MRDGAAAAFEALNASGLPPDTRVILSVADDACDAKQAVAVANKLTTERVRLVVGHFCSSSSIPASDIYAEAAILQVSPGSSNPQLTERGLLSFGTAAATTNRAPLPLSTFTGTTLTTRSQCSTTRAPQARASRHSLRDSVNKSFGKAM
ncbi:ABC transporter substrate-binding protein [Bradyrhizobium sp. CCBAU 11386]|uniref:ABC transporter substrate-binding protein n=1 Tax=Bradyrhizobium sp. CCBAU 11386 TaxID=1630837 RepID=UPI0023024472|nr:ABC transporter substrate-binding protein [Bradyrhizobium sp. CCBAU 11386]